MTLRLAIACIASLSGLGLATGDSLAQAKRDIRLYGIVEYELPAGISPDRLQGVKLYPRGGPAAPAAQPLGVVATGEVDEAAAADLGFTLPSKTPQTVRGAHCDHVAKAALVRLALAAKAKGADAVVDVHAIDDRGAAHTGQRASYVCIVRYERNPNPRYALVSASLAGTAVKLAPAP